MQSTDSAPHYSNTIHYEYMLSMHHGVSAYVCVQLCCVRHLGQKSLKAPVD